MSDLVKGREGPVLSAVPLMVVTLMSLLAITLLGGVLGRAAAKGAHRRLGADGLEHRIQVLNSLHHGMDRRIRATEQRLSSVEAQTNQIRRDIREMERKKAGIGKLDSLIVRQIGEEYPGRTEAWSAIVRQRAEATADRDPFGPGKPGISMSGPRICVLVYASAYEEAQALVQKEFPLALGYVIVQLHFGERFDEDEGIDPVIAA